MPHYRWIALFCGVLLAWAGPSSADDVTMKMTTTDGSTSVGFKNSADAAVGSINSSGQLDVSSNVRTGGYVSIPELGTVGAATANRARLYAKDIGGNTYLAYKDSAGKERIIKPQVHIVVSATELVAQNLGTTYKDVHYGVTASALSRTVVNFDGFTEARIAFSVDNNEADTITCRIYNTTDALEITSAASDASGNPVFVTGNWVPIALTGDKIVQAQCREGTGATADPDIGPVRLQLR